MTTNTPAERRNREHIVRVRAVQARSHAERVRYRRAYLEHYEADLTDGEREQLEALRDA